MLEKGERGGLVVNASDSGSRGTGNEVLVIPRKRWLRPNMTGKLFTGTIDILEQN